MYCWLQKPKAIKEEENSQASVQFIAKILHSGCNINKIFWRDEPKIMLPQSLNHMINNNAIYSWTPNQIFFVYSLNTIWSNLKKQKNKNHQKTIFNDWPAAYRAATKLEL